MQYHMTRLSGLSTVTLEVPDEVADPSLVNSFPLLLFDYQVRVRTCKEAQQVSQAAQQDPSGYLEDQGVASPLWYVDDPSFNLRQKEWCVNFSQIARCLSRFGFRTERSRIQVKTRRSRAKTARTYIPKYDDGNRAEC